MCIPIWKLEMYFCFCMVGATASLLYLGVLSVILLFG